MHTNRLAEEKSPYLLQHAHNPVDWHAWNAEAFEKARKEEKPIFLSIGYSTCHWCHVMERESFESEEIAEVLNRYFVPVKVDREERPDVDRIYMTFVQATTGGGGWPMSVWLTPDLKPFFGGTYFPPESRWGRVGFKQVLEQLAAAWQNNRQQILDSGQDILEQLRGFTTPEGGGRTDEAVYDSAYYQFRRSFDSNLGGFGGAPKFPRPVSLNFLLRYAHLKKNDEAAEMALVTLREMAKGGMYDQLGGGFHRYSVDARWFVPHFEKMLYDQGQLAVSYIEAYRYSGEQQYADVARGILDDVLRDMTDSGGAFYSAEDADSVIDPANPHEKGEGAFYIWTRDELDEVLGSPVADWFSWRFGVEDGGNVHEDPHGEFTSRNILYQKFTVEETARHFGAGAQDIRKALDEAVPKLMLARNKRVRPHLDDKILTGWNGLMISGFAAAARTLGDARYLKAAQRAASFILDKMSVDGMLLRRYRDGEAAISGFLDDYAFFVQALLDLYEADFDDNHVRTALELTSRMRQLFEDKINGAFFSTTDVDPSLVLRVKEDYDGAEPSGNSIAILNLTRLARITGNSELHHAAERALNALSRRMNSGPVGLPQMVVAHMFHSSPPRQIVIAGEKGHLGVMHDSVSRRFLPFHTLLWSGSWALNPELKNMTAHAGRPTAYVCENFTCQLPVSDVGKLAELLQ